MVLNQAGRTVRFGRGLVTNLWNPVWFGQKYAAQELLYFLTDEPFHISKVSFLASHCSSPSPELMAVLSTGRGGRLSILYSVETLGWEFYAEKKNKMQSWSLTFNVRFSTISLEPFFSSHTPAVPSHTFNYQIINQTYRDLSFSSHFVK